MENTEFGDEMATASQIALVRLLEVTTNTSLLCDYSTNPETVYRVFVAKNAHTSPAVLTDLAALDPHSLVRSNAIANPSTPLDALVRAIANPDPFTSEQAATLIQTDRVEEWLDYIQSESTPMEELHRALYSPDPYVKESVREALTGSLATQWAQWKVTQGFDVVYDLEGNILEEWLAELFGD